MSGEIINGLIATYGVPVAFVLWMVWQRMQSDQRRDPTREVLDTLRALNDKTDEINGRVIRLETKWEMSNGN